MREKGAMLENISVNSEQSIEMQFLKTVNDFYVGHRRVCLKSMSEMEKSQLFSLQKLRKKEKANIENTNFEKSVVLACSDEEKWISELNEEELAQKVVERLHVEERPQSFLSAWNFSVREEIICGRVFELKKDLAQDRKLDLFNSLAHFCEPYLCWNNGIVMRAKSESFLLETKKHGLTQRLEIFKKTNERKHSSLFDEIVVCVEEFLRKEISNSEIHCCSCLKEVNNNSLQFSGEPSCKLKVEECVLACVKKAETIKCAAQHQVLLEELCPDISLAHLSHRQVSYSDLKVGRVLGQGSFAQIFKGKLEEKTIAIKQLLLSKPIISHFDDTESINLKLEKIREMEKSTYNSLRNELRVLSKLEHPNLLSLVAFSKKV